MRAVRIWRMISIFMAGWEITGFSMGKEIKFCSFCKFCFFNIS